MTHQMGRLVYIDDAFRKVEITYVEIYNTIE